MQICPDAIILSNWGGLNPLMDMKSQSICWPQKNCLVAFFHVSLPLLISCPCITLKLPLAFPVAVLQVCLANLKARLSFFLFFLSFVVPLSLMLLFPLGRGWSLLSCSCSKKRCQVNLLVPPATVAARCFARRQQLSYKGFFTKQGLCACHCSPELFIPELRSWFLTHTVFMGGCGATCCKYILCQLILLYFSSSSTKDTKLSQEISLKL